MKRNHFARKKRQLKALTQRLHYLISSQKLDVREQIDYLIKRINNLIRDLLGVLSHAELKKILGASAILFGISFTSQVEAQSFAPPIENPFGLVSTNENSFPAFADLDGDEDLDLLVGEYGGSMQYFENIGDANNPQYAPPVNNPFGLESTLYYAFPAFADLDGDGDMDLMVGEYGTFGYPAQIHYFENIGSSINPQFAPPLENPFGLYSPHGEGSPAAVDIDNDQDMDVFVGEDDSGALFFFENIGSLNNPQFSSPVENPFGLNSVNDGAFLDFADLDSDDDEDLLVGEFGGSMQYFENVGSNDNPEFSTPQENPFGITSVNNLAFPALDDLDNDGDSDLLVGEYPGSMQYFKNLTITNTSLIDYNTSLKISPNPIIDILYIETEEKVKRIEILNMLGEVELSVQSNINKISLMNLKPGFYTVKITFIDNKYIVRKIIKK